MNTIEKHRARNRERYALIKDDPEFRAKAKARSKRHYHENKEKYIEKSTEWRLKNPDRHNFLSRRPRRKKQDLEDKALILGAIKSGLVTVDGI